jgi:hypothetical protein
MRVDVPFVCPIGAVRHIRSDRIFRVTFGSPGNLPYDVVFGVAQRSNAQVQKVTVLRRGRGKDLRPCSDAGPHELFIPC